MNSQAHKSYALDYKEAAYRADTCKEDLTEAENALTSAQQKVEQYREDLKLARAREQAAWDDLTKSRQEEFGSGSAKVDLCGLAPDEVDFIFHKQAVKAMKEVRARLDIPLKDAKDMVINFGVRNGLYTPEKGWTIP